MADERTPEQIQAELAEIDTAIVQKETGDAPPQQPVQVDNQPDPAEIEASRHGWVPKDKYKGDPNKWKPARQYLDDGLKFNSNIKRELEQLKSRYAELERTGQAFAKFHEEAMAKKEQEIKDAIADTRRRARAAAREGDDDLAETLETRMELLQEEQETLKQQRKEAVTAPVPPQNNAIREDGSANMENMLVRAWVEDGNEWFDQNADLRAYAVSVGQQLVQEGETLRGRALLDKVADRVRSDFPRQFKKKEETTPRADQVSGGGNNRSASGPSVHDLPPEDLKLMKEFIAKGWTTKEKFLANYFGEGQRRVHRSKS